MTDLAAWLLEQIAEDERVAREAAAVAASPWRWGDRIELGQFRYGLLGRHPVQKGDAVVFYTRGNGPDYATAEHIAEWDPARVLAECEAKRRIIDLAAEAEREDAMKMPGMAGAMFSARASLAGAMVQALAVPFADRPGYQEWRA